MRARNVATRLERVHRRPYRVDVQLRTTAAIPRARPSRDKIKAKYTVVSSIARQPK
jgi:hypothetical protein